MRQAVLAAALLLGTGYLVSTMETNNAHQTQPASELAKDKNSSTPNTTQPLKVDFQDAQPLSMTFHDNSKFYVSFFVRNDEDFSVTLSFDAVLQDNQKKVLNSSPKILSDATVPQNRLRSITIEIDTEKYDVPLSGYLEMTASGGPENRKPPHLYRALKIPPALPSNIATRLFGWTLYIAIAAVVTSIIVLAAKDGLGQRLGPPSWNFSDSWGTNITVAGAVLSTLLSFSALPEQTHYLNKIAYLCLSLIFSALITIAPSIYALIRTPVNVQGSDTPQYQGYVVPFAIASGVTLWGALGQLGTVALLFGELVASKEIANTILCWLIVLLGVVAVLLVIYAVRMITGIPKQHGAPKLVAKGAEAAPTQRLQSWPVL
ncbi:MAG: hypothetical protein ACM3JB_21105 [Acidobacteriaceae bacterium]